MCEKYSVFSAVSIFEVWGFHGSENPVVAFWIDIR